MVDHLCVIHEGVIAALVLENFFQGFESSEMVEIENRRHGDRCEYQEPGAISICRVGATFARVVTEKEAFCDEHIEGL